MAPAVSAAKDMQMAAIMGAKDIARATFGVRDHLVEVLSFLPPEDFYKAAPVVGPTHKGKEARTKAHQKVADLYLRSLGRERTRVSIAELATLKIYFSKNPFSFDQDLLGMFLKYFPKLQELQLRHKGDYYDFDFIRSDIRTLCPDFKGLRVPEKTRISWVRDLVTLNERVPLYSLAYKWPEEDSEKVIPSLTQLRVSDVMGNPTQAQMDAYGQLPHLRKLVMHADTLLEFKGFHELESLVLYWVYKHYVKSEVFMTELSTLPKLKALHVQLVEGGGYPISNFAKLSHLMTLALKGVIALNELQKLMATSPLLDTIILPAGKNILIREPEEVLYSVKNPQVFQRLRQLQEQFPNIALLMAHNVRNEDELENQHPPLFPDLVKPKPPQLIQVPASAAAPAPADAAVPEEGVFPLDQQEDSI